MNLAELNEHLLRAGAVLQHDVPIAPEAHVGRQVSFQSNTVTPTETIVDAVLERLRTLLAVTHNLSNCETFAIARTDRDEEYTVYVWEGLNITFARLHTREQDYWTATVAAGRNTA